MGWNQVTSRCRGRNDRVDVGGTCSISSCRDQNKHADNTSRIKMTTMAVHATPQDESTNDGRCPVICWRLGDGGGTAGSLQPVWVQGALVGAISFHWPSPTVPAFPYPSQAKPLGKSHARLRTGPRCRTAESVLVRGVADSCHQLHGWTLHRKWL